MIRVLPSTVLLLAILGGGVAEASPSGTQTWNQTIQQAAFVKDGLKSVRNPHYEYECLGLGGTVMRVGPYGFTRPGAGAVTTNGWLNYQPYLSYQYWWDDAAHRQLPFDLVGGYGENLDPGTVTAFRQVLDISRGFLTVDLGIKIDGAGSNSNHVSAFHSHREMFVTPEGVLVIRVTNASGAHLPFRLHLGINHNVRIYLNGGSYAKPHAPWMGSGITKPGGMVVVARRPHSCTATLGIAYEGANGSVDPGTLSLGSSLPGKTVTFYIAPGSSYENTNPVAAAWKKAATARTFGYDAERRETAGWWRQFFDHSAVNVPDRDLAKWFARSTYYLGVFFGGTDIPPGCNGASIESFAGAVCPEYDLVLDQMALLYGNHFSEARRVVAWLGKALPQTEHYATNGMTLRRISVKYRDGAKFGPLMGYDGTMLTPPTDGEGTWAHEDFTGNNAALMALNYVAWSGDARFAPLARRMLKETTQVSVADLQWHPKLNAWLNRHSPSTVQQAGTLFALRASIRQNVAEAGWKELASNVLLPTAYYQGKPVLAGGPGATPAAGSGDATWFSPAWYYSLLADDDPLVRDSYALLRTSTTGNYVFNNGWMGVLAAKLHEGEEACGWAKQFLRPGVSVFDDTCFGELVSDFEDFKKTPEVAAHAALVCNIIEMLVNPDDADTITIFPAIPQKWQQQGVAFHDLAVRNDILVSGEFYTNQVRVTLENCSDEKQIRNLRVRLPAGTTRLSHHATGLTVEDGWAVMPSVSLFPKQHATFIFTPSTP